MFYHPVLLVTIRYHACFVNYSMYECYIFKTQFQIHGEHYLLATFVCFYFLRFQLSINRKKYQRRTIIEIKKKSIPHMWRKKSKKTFICFNTRQMLKKNTLNKYHPFLSLIWFIQILLWIDKHLPQIYIQILTSSTCKCDLIWK